MEETTDRFSDRKHVIPAGWALISSLVTGFLFLVLGHYLSSGPQEVKVINPVDTVYIAENNGPNDPITPEQLEDFLQRLTTKSTAESLTSASEITDVRQGRVKSNAVRIPSYQLPSTVGGYTRKSLNGFARSSCPESPLSRGDLITVSFDLFNSNVVDETTPIFVRLIEVKEDQNVQRFEQQYRLKRSQNILHIASEFPSGEYELLFGFYIESELGHQYPPFYARSCQFRIVE